MLGIILQNVLFHSACQLTTGCPAGGGDPLFLIEKLSMVAIFGCWVFYNVRWKKLQAS